MINSNKQEKIFLIRIEELFQVTAYGLVLAPGLLVNDWINIFIKTHQYVQLELIKPSNELFSAIGNVFYPFPVPAPKEKKFMISILSLTKKEIPIGTNVWLMEILNEKPMFKELGNK